MKNYQNFFAQVWATRSCCLMHHTMWYCRYKHVIDVFDKLIISQIMPQFIIMKILCGAQTLIGLVSSIKKSKWLILPILNSNIKITAMFIKLTIQVQKYHIYYFHLIYLNTLKNDETLSVLDFFFLSAWLLRRCPWIGIYGGTSSNDDERAVDVSEI